MANEDTQIPGPLNNVIRIDDERIKGHLDRVVRGTVEETLNALLEAEADRMCNAERYERTEARRDPLRSQRTQLPRHGQACFNPSVA
jgi:transposase-like protein